MQKIDFTQWKRGIIEGATEWYPTLRLGQAVWNYVSENYTPKVYASLKGTDCDCFYHDDRIDTFLRAVYNKIYIDGQGLSSEDVSVDINEDWLVASGFNKYDKDKYNNVWMTAFPHDDVPRIVILTENKYDNTWTYEDYRNRIYGLTTTGQLGRIIDFCIYGKQTI